MSDERVKKNPGEDKLSRATYDRAIVDRHADDFVEWEKRMLKLQQQILPDLPEIPGYHVCWVGTSNQQDNPYTRQANGYELIKPEEVPEFKAARAVTTGEFSGYVGVNEMVAMKIEQRRYNWIINHFHGKLADDHDERLRSAEEKFKEMMSSQGGKVTTYRDN